MSWLSLLQALPVQLLQPLGLAVAVPILLAFWILVSRTGAPGRLALRLALRTSLLLSAGIAIIVAVATVAVLRAGLTDSVIRYERTLLELAAELSDTPISVENMERVRPRLAIAMATEPRSVWSAVLAVAAPTGVIAFAGPVSSQQVLDASQRVASASLEARSIVQRRNGRLELVVLAPVRGREGEPTGTLLFALNTLAETSAAARIAWLLLGWCTGLLVLSSLATRQLISVSVSEQVRELIALLQRTTRVRPGSATPTKHDELEQLRVEVDRTVDNNVRLQRERDAQYELIVERLPDAVIICEGNIIRFANAAAVELHGTLSLDRLLGTDFRARLSEDSGPVTSETAGRWSLRRDDGTQRFVEIAEATLPSDGETRTEIVIRDVTARVRAERALARSESVYRALFDSAPIGIAVVNAQLHMQAVNPALVRLFGRSHRSELIGRALGDTVQLTDASVAQLQKGLRSVGTGRIDVDFTPADGARKTAMVTMELLPSEDGAAQFELLWLDLTAQRALEAQVQRTQKLDAVGQLSSGIAHDFNNLLTVIRANASLLGTMQGRGRELDEIEEATVRGAALVRKLMLFSRKEDMAPQAWPVSTLLPDLIGVLQRLLPAQVVLQTPTTFPDAAVMVDRTAFEQVMMNLATNASDAMPSGGELQITCRMLAADAVTVRRPTPAPVTPWLEFTVSDSGVGMTPQVRDRAFEPFFTTKSAEKGSGLGLAIVYGLVTQMGGTVTITDGDVRGTRVTILLPECDEDAPTETVVSAAEPTLDVNANLLLVEDDPAVRASTAKLLARLGYTVTTAEDGVDALEQLTAGPRPDIIVSDVMMPRMGGVQLVQEIRTRNWMLPILLVSGYSTESLAEIAATDAHVGILGKPWSLPNMARALRERLTQRAAELT